MDTAHRLVNKMSYLLFRHHAAIEHTWFSTWHKTWDKCKANRRCMQLKRYLCPDNTAVFCKHVLISSLIIVIGLNQQWSADFKLQWSPLKFISVKIKSQFPSTLYYIWLFHHISTESCFVVSHYPEPLVWNWATQHSSNNFCFYSNWLLNIYTFLIQV